MTEHRGRIVGDVNKRVRKIGNECDDEGGDGGGRFEGFGWALIETTNPAVDHIYPT